jgi:hypothetical protein
MRTALAIGVSTLLLAAAPLTQASAQSVSIRIDSPQWGVRIGTDLPPLYPGFYPAAVVVAPPPVVYSPPPVVYVPVYAPAPRYIAPAPVYYGYGPPAFVPPGHRHKHHRIKNVKRARY